MILNFYHIQVFSSVNKDLLINKIEDLDSEFSSILWRIKEKKFTFYKSDYLYNFSIPPLGFELINTNSFWCKIDDNPQFIFITKISISQKIDNHDKLFDWLNSILIEFNKHSSSDITRVKFNNRNSSTICVIDEKSIDLNFHYKINNYSKISDHLFLYNGKLASILDSFWIVMPSSKHRTGGEIVNSQTILYFFINILCLKHIISDITIKSIPYIKELKTLEKPHYRSILLDNYRYFLLSKIYFSARYLVQYWEHDLLIWDFFYINNNIKNELTIVEQEMNAIIDLSSHAASISAANSSYNTSIATTMIWLIGIIGTMAGIIQAIDNPIEPVPFESRGSILRLILIMGISIFLLLFAGLFILFREKFLNLLNGITNKVKRII